MGIQEKPEIRLWIFNNPIAGITDQIEFIKLSFEQSGYKVSVSNRPSLSALNVVIENFSNKTFAVVDKFVKEYSKSIALVLTEHLDYIDNKIFFHGFPLNRPGDYMHPLTRRARLLHLLIARNHIKYLIRLGDLPELNGVENMMCDLPIITIPFPKLPCVDRSSYKRNFTYDMIFTGMVTAYREKVLNSLKNDFNILIIDSYLSRRRRDAANCSAKAILNIPQYIDWEWVSTMRVLAGWRCGRCAINIAVDLKGVLTDLCINYPALETNNDYLKTVVSSFDSVFSDQISTYNHFIASEENSKFPDAAFKVWAMLELGVEW